MKLWFLGDNSIVTDVQSFATSINATLIDSSAPNALPEQVTIEQTHNREILRNKDDLIIVVYVKGSDFDSENLLHRALLFVHTPVKILVLVDDDNFKLVDGYKHYTNQVALLPPANISNTLTVLYNAA